MSRGEEGEVDGRGRSRGEEGGVGGKEGGVGGEEGVEGRGRRSSVERKEE